MKTRGKGLAITGVVFLFGPMFGLIGTIIGMISAFQTMEEGVEGNAEKLAADMHFALITTAIGLIVALVGWVLIFVALFGFKYRASWFYWFLCVFSILWLVNFPVGTIIGIGMLIYLIKNKSTFHAPENEPLEIDAPGSAS